MKCRNLEVVENQGVSMHRAGFNRFTVTSSKTCLGGSPIHERFSIAVARSRKRRRCATAHRTTLRSRRYITSPIALFRDQSVCATATIGRKSSSLIVRHLLVSRFVKRSRFAAW